MQLTHTLRLGVTTRRTRYAYPPIAGLQASEPEPGTVLFQWALSEHLVEYVVSGAVTDSGTLAIGIVQLEYQGIGELESVSVRVRNTGPLGVGPWRHAGITTQEIPTVVPVAIFTGDPSILQGTAGNPWVFLISAGTPGFLRLVEQGLDGNEANWYSLKRDEGHEPVNIPFDGTEQELSIEATETHPWLIPQAPFALLYSEDGLEWEAICLFARDVLPAPGDGTPADITDLVLETYPENITDLVIEDYA